MGTSGNVSFTKDFSTFLKTVIFEGPQQWFSFYMPGLTAGIIVLPMVLKVLTVESLRVSPVVLFYMPGLIAEIDVLPMVFKGFCETVIWFFIYRT